MACDIGVDDGTRTHDDRDHNPGLYQLSYAHHGIQILARLAPPVHSLFSRKWRARQDGPPFSRPVVALCAPRCEPRFSSCQSLELARPAGFEPATAGLAYQLPLSRPRLMSGLWSGLSLRHLRRRTYSLYGSPRTVNALRFPRDCHQRYLLRVPRYSAVHCTGSVSRHRLLT